MWCFMTKTENQIVHLAKNVRVIGKLFSGKNKMKSILLIVRFDRSINNVFLLSICFAKQTFHTISVMRTLKQSFTCAKHSLSGVLYGQFAGQINQNDCRRLYTETLFMKWFNNLPTRQSLIFGKSMSDWRVLHFANLRLYGSVHRRKQPQTIFELFCTSVGAIPANLPNHNSKSARWNFD